MNYRSVITETIFKVLNDVKKNYSENLISIKREVQGVYTEHVRFKKIST